MDDGDPTYKLPPIPTPPNTTKAPVEVFVLAAADVIFIDWDQSILLFETTSTHWFVSKSS